MLKKLSKRLWQWFVGEEIIRLQEDNAWLRRNYQLMRCSAEKLSLENGELRSKLAEGETC